MITRIVAFALHQRFEWLRRRPQWRGRITRYAGPSTLLAVSVLLLFFDFGVRVLATNDETRFPMLARDILARGDWLLPRLGGLPHLNKPPLYAWLVALAAWPGGAVTQSSALWPSLVAAVGVMIATSWIGWRLWNRGIGLTAGFIVLTTHGVLTLARAPMPDMMLCFVITAAMAAFVAAEFSGRRLMLAVFYVLLGVGFWTKGLAALLGLATVVVFTLRPVRGWPGRRLALPAGLLLVALMITPWFVLSATSGRGRFLREIVMTDWLLWYLPIGQWRWHVITEPIAQTLSILLPWSPLLPFAVVSAVGMEAKTRARNAALLLVWLGVVFVLVGASTQQRMRYYLPLCPPAALLVALWYHQLTLRHRKVLGMATAALVVAGLMVWQTADDARHNALTNLRGLDPSTVKVDTPIYAVDVPELVLAFYLDRPVVALRTYAASASDGPIPPTGYFAVADRVLPQWLGHRLVVTIATGVVNGQGFSVLAPESPSRMQR